MQQVTADLARLGQEASNIQRTMTSSIGSIDAVNLNVQQLEDEMDREKVAYETAKKADKEELEKRKANLEVGTFGLEFTRCKGGAAAALFQGQRKREENE